MAVLFPMNVADILRPGVKREKGWGRVDGFEAQITKRGGGQLQSTEADIVQGLIVDAHDFIG